MTGCGWSGIKNWGMSWAMMKSHYQRGQKILKDDLKERKKKVKNSWTTLKSSPLFYLDLFKNDNGNCHFFQIWDFSDSCTIFFPRKEERNAKQHFLHCFDILIKFPGNWWFFFFFLSFHNSISHYHWKIIWCV